MGYSRFPASCHPIVWFLAFAPIIGELLRGIIIGIKYGDGFEAMIAIAQNKFWFITLILNVALGIADERYLVKKGIEKGELIEAEPEVLASELFSLACGNLYYKKDNVIDIEKLYKEIDKTFIQFLKK